MPTGSTCSEVGGVAEPEVPPPMYGVRLTPPGELHLGFIQQRSLGSVTRVQNDGSPE